MDPRPACVLLILLLLHLVETRPHLTQDCRVYHLQNGTERHRGLAVPFPGHLEVSLRVGKAELAPRSLIIYLDAATATHNQSVQVYITNESEVILRVAERRVGGLLALAASAAHTWISLVLAHHHGTLLVYRPEDRINMLTAAVSLEGNVTASVHCKHELHLAFNCGTGCLVHDGSSPLVGTVLGLGSSLGFYMTPQGAHLPRAFHLSPSTYRAKAHNVLVDMTPWEVGRWYKVQLFLDQEDVGVRGQVSSVGDGGPGRGQQVSLLKLAAKNVSYILTNVTGVLWTLQCYPDMAAGKEAGVTRTDLPPTTPTYHRQAQGEPAGAGAGEVVAWVLAGLAMFVVALLALALCTKMTPPLDRPPDFLPSVGVLSQRCDMVNNGREAEEESEPGSPMLMVPPGSHGLPHAQHYSSKVL